MYVQWLLEFIWRIFIQGPLLIINFFTSSSNGTSIINKIFGNISFIPNDNNLIGTIVDISLLISLIVLISLIFMIGVFVFKAFKVLIISREENAKYQIIEFLKEFAKSFFFILIFTIFFGTLFIFFDSLMLTLNEVLANLSSNTTTPGGATIQSIPLIIYYLITGVQTADNQFLFPDNFLSQANSMNFLFSIVFVLVFSFFIIWIMWSIFQKMIEIIFLYITFPISLSFSMESQKINWRIWIKEIINKMLLIFMLTIFLRLFLYLFLIIYSNITSKLWSDHNELLYINLFVVFALAGSTFFALRLFSNKNRENIGFFGSVNSFKQTRNFITNNKNISVVQNPYSINLEPINSNIKILRNDVSKLSNNVVEYKNIRKVKVFNK